MEGFFEFCKSVIVPLVVGLGSCLVTLHISRSQLKDKKEERKEAKEKRKEADEDQQNSRLDALERTVGKVVVQTNENSAMNYRLLEGMSVLIDAGEINGTINGPGKKWLRETQEYVIQKGFRQMEIKSLVESSSGKKRSNATVD